MTAYDPDEKSRLISDGMAFNDPDAWGYCEYCAFLVAVVKGKLIVHPEYRNSPNDGNCRGGGQKPTEDVPYAAMPRRLVNIRKDKYRSESRGRKQRQRTLAREARRRKAEEEAGGGDVAE